VVAMAVGPAAAPFGLTSVLLGAIGFAIGVAPRIKPFGR